MQTPFDTSLDTLGAGTAGSFDELVENSTTTPIPETRIASDLNAKGSKDSSFDDEPPLVGTGLNSEDSDGFAELPIEPQPNEDVGPPPPYIPPSVEEYIEITLPLPVRAQSRLNQASSPLETTTKDLPPPPQLNNPLIDPAAAPQTVSSTPVATPKWIDKLFANPTQQNTLQSKSLDSDLESSEHNSQDSEHSSSYTDSASGSDSDEGYSSSKKPAGSHFQQRAVWPYSSTVRQTNRSRFESQRQKETNWKYSGSSSESTNTDSSSSSESYEENPKQQKQWKNRSAPTGSPTRKSAPESMREPFLQTVYEDSDNQRQQPFYSYSGFDFRSTKKMEKSLPKNALARLLDNIEELENKKGMKDLEVKTLALYDALIELREQDELERDHIESGSISSDEDSQSSVNKRFKRLSVDSYAELTSQILECKSKSRRDVLIEEFNEAAECASGSPSRGWQVVGALMMAVGVALMALGGLTIAGTLGWGTPAGGGMIGAGGFVFASGLTLFSKNRRQGVSQAMKDFAEEATSLPLPVEKEKLSDSFSSDEDFSDGYSPFR